MTRFRFSEAAEAGPVSLGEIDWTTLGTATYTTSGAKTLGGLSFTLSGVDATNTFVIDSSGARAVGGTTTQVALDFDAATHLGFTPDAMGVYGMSVEIDDGAVTGSDILFSQVGNDTSDRVGLTREVTNKLVSAAWVAGFFTDQILTVANAVDIRGLGFVIAGRVSKMFYHLGGSPAGIAPNAMSNSAKSSGDFDTAGFYDFSFVRHGFSNARGKNVTLTKFWDYQ